MKNLPIESNNKKVYVCSLMAEQNLYDFRRFFSFSFFLSWIHFLCRELSTLFTSFVSHNSCYRVVCLYYKLEVSTTRFDGIQLIV